MLCSVKMADQEYICKVVHRQTGTFVRCYNDLNLVLENYGPINCVSKSLERTSGAYGV